MNWYKYAQIELADFPITQQEMDSALNRAYEKSRIYLKEMDVSRSLFMSPEYKDELEQILWSDSELYMRYFKNIPSDINISDILNAYFSKTLPTTKNNAYQPQPITMENTPDSTSNKDYQNHLYSMSDEDIRLAWQTALQRSTKATEDDVRNARYQIFTQWMTNKELPNVLNIELREINKKVKSWSGAPQKAIALSENLNKDVPEQTQWHGIINSSWLSQKEISHEDMDQYVGLIELPEGDPKMQEEWKGSQGKQVRNTVVKTLKALDTNIDYKNLGFTMKEIKALGQYEPMNRRILLRETYGDTIPHEIGHYLDHKWAEEAHESAYKFSHSASTLLDSYIPDQIKNPVRRQWMEKIHHFVLDISEKSDISSEYRQERPEVFARFIAKFVEWTQKQAGMKSYFKSDFHDKFYEQDYRIFVKLLQEKAYVDLIDPPQVPDTQATQYFHED